MPLFSLDRIQKSLRQSGVDGWLFYDFQGNDPVGRGILDISHHSTTSRRWFYYIPRQGVPYKFVHILEPGILDHLPGKQQVYMGWEEMHEKLRLRLAKGKKIAIQYSPRNAVPYISRIDAGTFELLKELKLDLISSASLVQQIEARWSEGQLNTHKNAARSIVAVAEKAFRFIKRKVNGREEVTEFMMQKYISRELKKNGLVFDHGPAVAAGINTGNPVYRSTRDKGLPIYKNSLLQISIAAREKSDHAVFAVLSQVGFVGKTVPEDLQDVFGAVCGARDAAVAAITHSIEQKNSICGWQVDDTARNYLKKRGYDKYFLHRTGHSVGMTEQANGVNIDNLETRDEREIIPHSAFTISPAVYFSDYGMRSGVTVYVDQKGAHIYTRPLQKEITAILK